MEPLLVNEIFWSVQGEGFFTGTPAVFVRLQGCDVRCPWCDTGYALDLDRTGDIPRNDALVLAKETSDARRVWADPAWIVERLLADPRPVRHVILTGGEPFLQPLVPLLALLDEQGFFVQVETSGTARIDCLERTWITLSPKRRKLPLPESWARADEIKLPVLTADDLDFFAPWLEGIPAQKIRLQPVSQDREATRLCIETCLARNWRLSLQTHKFIDLR